MIFASISLSKSSVCLLFRYPHAAINLLQLLSREAKSDPDGFAQLATFPHPAGRKQGDVDEHYVDRDVTGLCSQRTVA